MSNTEAGETAAGFVIDGEVYAIPSLYSFDMDENQIMFNLSGRPTEDWLMVLEGARAADATAEFVAEATAELRNPGLLRAFVHVAYRRVHRDVDFGDVEVVVGRSNQVANWAALFLGDSEDAEPEPDPTLAASTEKDDVSWPLLPEHETPMSGGYAATSGTDSGNASGQRVANLLRTGTGG